MENQRRADIEFDLGGVKFQVWKESHGESTRYNIKCEEYYRTGEGKKDWEHEKLPLAATVLALLSGNVIQKLLKTAEVNQQKGTYRIDSPRETGAGKPPPKPKGKPKIAKKTNNKKAA